MDPPSKDDDRNPELVIATTDPAAGLPSRVVTAGPSSVISFSSYVDPLKFLGQLWQQYGDVVRYQTRFSPCFLFVHPQHVQTILRNETFRRAPLIKMMFGDGLLISDGPRWKSQRRVMQRDFLPRSVAPLVPVMVRETARTADAWRQAAVAGHTVDVLSDMARLTLRIVVKALFSDDLSDARVTELCAAVAHSVSEQGKLSWLIFGMPAHFTAESAANITASKAALDALAYEMIRRRRFVASPDRPRDILTLLIEAETDSGPMSELQIRDEIVTLLIGGQETTAVSLSWAWKAIAEHPDIEMRLHRELDQVLGGKSAELDDVTKLSWTRAIFQEALRLYPPVWYMARIASEDAVVHGHLVPRGANVLVSPWFTHRHKEFWPDPERFDPTRFVDSPAQATHRDAYLPFAGGRHTCLGMHFALLEGTLVLAQIAREFRVRPINGQAVRPNAGVTLRLSPGLSATIELRHAARHGSTPAARSAALETQTLWDIVRRRAVTDADATAYTFLADGGADALSITWSQLARRATALGEFLHLQGASGQPVLLALPSGLKFVEWLFACWHAGAIIVPVSLPRHQRVKHRLEAIVADAGARFAIASTATRQRLQLDPSDARAFAALSWIDADAIGTPISEPNSAPPRAQRVALLQYTSGSTGTPRGVIVTHENLMCNSALITQATGLRAGETIAGWLPLFHDMGLIGFVLQAACSGARCVFMAPERFLMQPWLWLQMMSDYGACSSAAPNFAYDLCVEKISAAHKATLDLSHWRNALNGSEPVRAATLERFAAAFAECGFRPEAFFPCYGLAEATLFAAGPSPARGRWTRRNMDGTVLAETEAGGHVGCGRAFGDTQIAIVDPTTASRVSPGEVGEIWLAGSSIAEGYWNNPQDTAAAFRARIAGNMQSAGDPEWLRTGDLGFVAGGELFITGRLRELIIVAGRNHFPSDIESSVESADPAIASSGAVAFSLDLDGTERLIIAAEVRREYRRTTVSGAARELDPVAIRQRIRAAVVSFNEVSPYEVMLLRPGAVPRTSSGKISRLATRDAYLSRTLDTLEDIPDAHGVT